MYVLNMNTQSGICWQGAHCTRLIILHETTFQVFEALMCIWTKFGTVGGYPGLNHLH